MRGENTLLHLWRNEAPHLRRYFRRALSDYAVADDLTSETFTQLAAAMERGSVENPEALLRTIAQRQLAFEIRRRQKDSVPVGGLDDLEAIEVEPPETITYTQHGTFEDAEFQEGFDRAVRALPEPELHAFVLTELRGLSHEEAAAVLGVSHVTVGKRRQLALDSVRRALLAG